MILKKCEICGQDFVCRKDKLNSSRVCSLECRGALGGKEYWKDVHEKWKLESDEDYLENIKKSFERFFDKSDTCWLWKGGTKGHGRLPYGSFCFRNKNYSAHRASWLIYKGEIPEKKLVLHTCDNASCVNPNHLYLGTYLDNQRDKLNRGRCKVEKLTIEQVKEIKHKIANGVMLTRICKDYKISKTTIHSIKKGKTWRDIVL